MREDFQVGDFILIEESSTFMDHELDLWSF